MGGPNLAHPEIPGLEETNQKITNLKESNGIMCGIVGYIGQNDAYPVLIEGLKKLEYRGYDSAGAALINGQIADIRVGEELNIINLEHSACHYDIKTVDLDISKLSKGGFDHFMLKEINDQPNCLKDCMSDIIR